MVGVQRIPEPEESTRMAEPTISELVSRLEEQQARIEWLVACAEANASTVDIGGPAAADSGTARMSRRGMLMTAAAGTAGLIGGMLSNAQGAAAVPASGGPATFTSASATAAVTATDTGTGNAVLATAAVAAAVHGTQTGKGGGASALRGTIKPATGTGTGVIGEAQAGTGVSGTSASGSGVTGVSGTGTGISGRSTSGRGVTGVSSSGAGVAGTSTTGIAVSGTTPSTASGATAIQGTVSSTSPGGYSAGVYGQNNGTGGSGIGVYGAQNGFGWGVYGTTPSGSGVYGYSTSGYGVQAGSNSGTGIYASSTGGVGVDGHSSTNNAVQGTSGSGIGVQGSSSSNTGVQGVSSSGYGIYGSSPNNYAVVGVTTSGNAVYGQVSTAGQAGVVGRQEASGGNWALYGFGNIGASGTKSAVVEAADGKGHMTLYCVESPECWFEDFGAGRLKNGAVIVKIDPEFAQTIETDTYHVFLQAEGDCNGMIVTEKTASGFTVKETGGGTSSAPFSYRIVARRSDVVAPRLDRVKLPDVPLASPPVIQTLPPSTIPQGGNERFRR
jgi:hypothetical protein